ncbi:MAG: hypothetical protein WAN51_03320 [Alphaproteobacteria bacterium]
MRHVWPPEGFWDGRPNWNLLKSFSFTRYGKSHKIVTGLGIILALLHSMVEKSPKTRRRKKMLAKLKTRSSALEAALAAVERMDKHADLVLAPLEPSLEMVVAGATAGDISPKVAARIYRAMIRLL